MKNVPVVLVVIAAALIGVVLAGPFYVIDEGEQAVVVEMGRLVDVVTDAGLHIKIPFIDNVVRYPKRIMAWEGEQKSMPTREKQYIWVDVIARWRITDPRKFYESISTVSSAYPKLGDIIDSEVRTVVAENYLRETVRNSNFIIDEKTTLSTPETADSGEDVSSDSMFEEFEKQLSSIMQEPGANNEPIQKGRRRLAEEILARSRGIVDGYGIELIDVVIRQIRYSDELTQSVYARMIKERNQIAQAFRSEGEGKKAEWLGRTENEQRSILSAAYEQSEKIRGAADAEAVSIYSAAHGRDPAFFDFWRAMESYRLTMPNFDKTLTTGMDYFRYLNSPGGR
ncbi:MAG: protease modulator HflC [Spirochaetaceae bacterium]|jgi:membrane protease subunit HflC|nr:protease modulator HflC [Spirochaetaceae bacterium]